MKKEILLFILFTTLHFCSLAQKKNDFSFSIDCHEYNVKKRDDLEFHLRLTNLSSEQILIRNKHISEAKNEGNLGDVYYEIISYPKGDTITKTNKLVSFNYQAEDITPTKKTLKKFDSEVFIVRPMENFFLKRGGLHKIRFTYRVHSEKKLLLVSTGWVFLYVDKTPENWL